MIGQIYNFLNNLFYKVAFLDNNHEEYNYEIDLADLITIILLWVLFSFVFWFWIPIFVCVRIMEKIKFKCERKK